MLPTTISIALLAMQNYIYNNMLPGLKFLACLLYDNLITIYTTATKSASVLQNLMALLLQLTEWDSAFGTKDL